MDEIKEKVKAVLEEMVDQAGLLGLANMLKSATVNLELSEDHKTALNGLYEEIMEQERITHDQN